MADWLKDLAPYAGIVGDIAGGMFGSSEARSAAARSYKYWRRMQRFGPELRVEGLRRAGLNPILAAGGGLGAAGGMPAPTQGPVPQFGASARYATRHKAEVNQINQAANQQGAAAAYNSAQAVTETHRRRMIDAQRDQANNSAFASYQTGEGQRIANQIKNKELQFYSTPKGRKALEWNLTFPHGGTLPSGAKMASSLWEDMKKAAADFGRDVRTSSDEAWKKYTRDSQRDSGGGSW